MLIRMTLILDAYERAALEQLASKELRAIPGVRPTLADPRAADIDLVVLRESTEGMFVSRGKGEVTLSYTFFPAVDAKPTAAVAAAKSQTPG